MNTLRLLLITLFLMSCTNSSEKAIELTEEEEIIQQLQSEGFDTKTIVFHNDCVIVEDDIVFERSDVLAPIDTRSKGYKYSRLVSSSKVGKIKIRLKGLSSAWESAFRNAISEWNSVSSCNIKFTEVSSSLHTNLCTVKMESMSSSTTFATGNYPRSTGKIGRYVKVNSNYSSGGYTIETLPSSLKKKIAMHELGHTLGFRHPGDGTHVSGTESEVSNPGYNTIMRQGWILRSTLYSDDEETARTLY